MTKAEEFEALSAVDAPESLTVRANALAVWAWKNRDIIAAALKTADAFARGESTDDYAGYYSHEREYATEKLLPLCDTREAAFGRGYVEGWKAARRFVIQDP